MTVLKKKCPKELKLRQAAAEEAYRNRKAGYDQYAATDPQTGRAIGAWIDGAIEAVLAPTPLDILPAYLAKVEQGYSLHELGTVQLSASTYEVYMIKPEAVIKEALKPILAKVESDYANEVEEYNNAIIEKEIEAQLRIEEKREKELLAKAANEARARIEAEVRSALKAAT